MAVRIDDRRRHHQHDLRVVRLPRIAAEEMPGLRHVRQRPPHRIVDAAFILSSPAAEDHRLAVPEVDGGARLLNPEVRERELGREREFSVGPAANRINH